jgi:hypothetical protein
MTDPPPAALPAVSTPHPHRPWPQSQGGGPTASASTSSITFGVVGRGHRKVSAHELGQSWHAGCPVAPSQLRAVGVPYWGFDRRQHHGVIVVNRTVATAVQGAFIVLREDHFPIHRVEPVSVYGGSDNRSMRADNTSAFNCRPAVNDGPKTWSMHAYGEAIDLDPLENPYLLNGKVLPKAGARFADRSNVQAGMILADGPVVDAFTRIGWGWGGRWTSPDFQHFSVNGR